MNIPPTPLDSAKKILLIGAGGGFDVFTGLPFVFHWPDKEFVLTNSSAKSDFLLRTSTEEDQPECSISDISNIAAVYSIGRHGSKAVETALNKIIDRHQPDCILTVDGGVDSLSQGDEKDSGTILEDFITLAALSRINLPKVHCCAGFGCETEEDMNHYCVLQNMSELAQVGGFYGSFSLTRNMSEFTQYVNECERAWDNGKRKSHIQTKIISAAVGGFGSNNLYEDVDPKVHHSTGRVFISLLSTIFWMLNLDEVIANNKAIPYLIKGNTFADSQILLRQFLSDHLERRDHLDLPL